MPRVGWVEGAPQDVKAAGHAGEGPPAGTKGVGWTLALPEPHQSRQVVCVEEPVLQLPHQPISDQGFPLTETSWKPEGEEPQCAVCGGQPPLAGQGQRRSAQHRGLFIAMNLTFQRCLSHNFNVPFKYLVDTDTTTHNFGSHRESFLTVTMGWHCLSAKGSV